MDVSTKFSPLQEKLSAALVQSTRTTSQLLAEDIDFQRSINPSVSNSLDAQSGRLLGLTNSILRFATSGSDLSVPALEDEDSLDDNWKAVVDVIDELLEKADACLDEFTGIIKRLSPSQEERGQDLGKRASRAQFPSVYDFSSSRIPKPQLQFKNRIGNHDSSSFRPILRHKPHALVPLSTSADRVDADGRVDSYEHPYEQEIKKSHYPSSTYSKVTPQMYTSFDSTVATFVNTMDGVREMLAELKSAKEIAIDLEHHDTHSYHGLVCLMQISTREKDWIVDTLLPWREELQILNEVFADPNIMKVLHGSTMDVIWLQRDLGLYLVGLFDTYHAAVSLNYPKKSLKYLLEKFVNFQADKKYQMADWRLRPLLPGMFDYARSDTHYLLYIYDQLRNELIDNSTPQDNLIDYVQERSKSEALQRYERPVYDAETGQGAGGWYDVLYRGSSLLSREQLSVFKAVHQWRDQTARTEDEGPQSVLSKRALFAIAYGMPTDQAALLKLASPVSPALRKRLTNLLKVIKEAKIAGADGPELHEVLGTGAAKVMTERPVTTVPDELEIAPPSSEFQAIAMRAGLSQFWGTTLERSESTNVSPYASLAASDTLELSLPLPAAPINISDEPMRTGDDTAAVESTATTTPPSPEAPDQIFTVKQFGAPPKRKTAPNPVDSQPASSSSSSPSSPSDAAEDHSQSSSSSSSPAPTPKKKQKQKHNPNTATENMIPFDYANADSVLQAAPRPGNDGRNLPRKPQFNPYAKSLNAPQGLRRVKKDMGGGRSLTFQK